MDNLNRNIKVFAKELLCPVCGKRYTTQTIIQTACNKKCSKKLRLKIKHFQGGARVTHYAHLTHFHYYLIKELQDKVYLSACTKMALVKAKCDYMLMGLYGMPACQIDNALLFDEESDSNRIGTKKHAKMMIGRKLMLLDISSLMMLHLVLFD